MNPTENQYSLNKNYWSTIGFGHVDGVSELRATQSPNTDVYQILKYSMKAKIIAITNIKNNI